MRNLAAMTDADGVSLRYTVRQRTSESKLARFRKVLKKEKEDAGVTELEAKLSERSHRTNDLDGFWMFLEAKRVFDESAVG